ncbi:MAG: phage tail tube protein [Deltaproteobacteria bacterium]|nr:phage tail tube protein [Deltaproteobacteria bacterium]
MLTRRTTLLAKKETVYGTDPTPVAGDAVLCKVDGFRVIGDALVRDYHRSKLSPLAHVIGEVYSEIKFSTELKGSGAAGTAPELSPLFQACGFSETIVALTSVTYLPESDTFPSCTIYFYRDGILYEMNGCRGTFDIDLSVGKYGVINWTFQGLYVAPIDAALIDGTYDSTVPPPILSAAFSIQAYSAVATKLALSAANRLAFRRDLSNANGIREVLITDWDERGGSFDPEAVTVATHNFHSIWKAGTAAAMSIVVGSAAGNICTITAPKVQYREINPAERDGLYTYEVPIRLAQNAGDDELSIAFT